jgi:hypothetical protein
MEIAHRATTAILAAIGLVGSEVIIAIKIPFKVPIQTLFLTTTSPVGVTVIIFLDSKAGVFTTNTVGLVDAGSIATLAAAAG